MKRLISVTGLVAVACAVALFLTLGGGADKPQPPPFPDKTKVRVVAPPATAQEVIRYVTYPAKDSVTPEMVEIEYVNGDKGFIFYRQDGTTRLTTTYWPPANPDNPDGPRQLKEETEVALDGKTVLSDRSFRADGTLVRNGARLVDGNYEIFLFFADGIAIEKHQVVDKSDNALIEEIFRLDGSVSKSARLNADKRMEVTTFFADGKKESVIVLPRSYWDSITAEYWNVDGTRRMTVVYTTYGVTTTYYNPDDSARMKRVENNYGSTVETTMFNAAGDAAYRQTWRVEKETRPDGSVVKTYLLRQVEEYNKDGKVIRKIELAPDGKTPVSVTLPDPPGSYWGGTVKKFRQDGTLETVEVKDKDNKVLSTTTHTAEEGIREKFDPEYLEAAPFEEPPASPVRPAAPPMYGPY